MSEAYIHDRHKFADAGLQLRLPVDLVPSGQFSYLTNCIPLIEGELRTRAGLTLIKDIAAGQLHSIFRLNESIASVESTRLVGLGTGLYSSRLSAPTLFTTLLTTMSGSPLSIVSWRFTQDTAAWAIITDGLTMWKFRDSSESDSSYLLEALGNAPPTVPANPTVNGAGVLNTTGEPGYDYRYTYVNGYTFTESNPSPISTATVTRPTAFTNPYTPGKVAFINPGNAIDGSGATAASLAVIGDIPGLGQGGCLWNTWTSPGFTASGVVLSVDASFFWDGVGSFTWSIQYTTDGGTTWSTLSSGTAAADRRTYTTVLPDGVAFGQLGVRVIVHTFGGDGGSSVWDINTAATAASGTPTTVAPVNQSVNVCVTAPTLPEHLYIRLYRRGGSLPDAWRMVGQFQVSTLVVGGCGAGSLEINDNVSDTTLSAEPILQLDNDQPVTSVTALDVPLKYIWGPVGIEARLCGVGDPNRPEAVYFSKPGNADAWPPQNFVLVSSAGTPMQAGCVWNTRNFGFSRERIYELIEGLTSATFTPFETPSSRGLYSPWTLAVAQGGMYFMSKDGIYVSTGGVEESIVENDIKPIFPTYDTPGQDVNGYEAVDMSAPELMRLVYHNGELWYVYRGLTSQEQKLLIYDIAKKRWRAADYDDAILALHSEGNTISSLLVGSIAGVLSQTGGSDDDGNAIHVHVRTGAFDQNETLNMKEYGNVIIDIDPGGATVGSPVTITPYVNGDAQAEAALTVTGTGRQQVALDLSDFYAYNVSFDITWDRTSAINPILYQFDILYRVEPAALTHWETRGSAMGQPGYLHIRDLFVPIRSNADVTLIVYADEVPLTYTIPSTAGEQLKVHIPLMASKGKLYRFVLDSTDASKPFRIYTDNDIEARCKPWLGLLGYSIQTPFGQEQGGGDNS